MIQAAAYCRVSTDRSEQANSFAAQQRYFTEYLTHHPLWTLYRIYADEGLSGTSIKNREAFLAMLRDAEAGCFQVILTKEVSRFSRNILDTIACTRKLRDMGVRVIFLQDGIDTMEPDAELRLSILGTIAQEESRRISSRVKWGQTRQMERGVVFGRSLLGYDVKDGKMTINENGAAVVRKIFEAYVYDNRSAAAIARQLQSEGVPTYSGSRPWGAGQVMKILRNEKYVGDLLQKKTYTPNYLTHDKKQNHGQETMVFLQNHHEPIIDRSLWEAAQQRRTKRGRSGSAVYGCSGKIRCGLCGSRFIHKTKQRPDGTTYGCWYCAKAAAYGKAGCKIGVILRQELADRMLLQALRQSGMNGGPDTELLHRRHLEQIVVFPDHTAQLRLKNINRSWQFPIYRRGTINTAFEE